LELIYNKGIIWNIIRGLEVTKACFIKIIKESIREEKAFDLDVNGWVSVC
jgi:hypothetical protein